MKQKNRKKRVVKDFGFVKYFSIDASPHTHFDAVRGVFTYFAKNIKKIDSRKFLWSGKGTYIKAKHGELRHPLDKSTPIYK